MKGFLSFLGITLITIAFGAILFSFYGNPLEDLKKQERQQVFQEMRANSSASAGNHMTSTSTTKNGDDSYPIQPGQICLRLSFDH